MDNETKYYISMLWHRFIPVNFVKLLRTPILKNMQTAAFILFYVRMGSHLFLNFCLAAYIDGDTMLSKYYICDRSKNTTKCEEKVS